MAKVLVFFAEGFEEVEALTVVDLVRRAGIDTTMVSITGNKKVTGSHGITVAMDELIDDINFSEAQMIVLPGGMPGTRNLEAHDDLMRNVDDYCSSGRYVAAICAAPTILGHRGLLVGKKACCYPGLEDQLQGAEVTKDKVTVADKIITSRGVGTAIPFGLKIVETLIDKDTADNLASAIVFRA